ncbi:hypothetical protein BKA67DRAFT_348468 [Truncatella angustata]|uniref:Uncharacterized protein n=1 Tax=Truncatella angustata TaxID=152316 RepID=A0A9P8UH94_9PEZI|nr:uncharacterized protein BKA67DRAFT_348468 [Truncatella angustata]KAH6652118.1 hypothetical protein BKA67DRAFT_348468 [Truncatella angustata]
MISTEAPQPVTSHAASPMRKQILRKSTSDSSVESGPSACGVPVASAIGAPEVTQISTRSVRTTSTPQPVYYPGGWRSEWNHLAIQIHGLDIVTEASTGGSIRASTYASSCFPQALDISSSAPTSSSPVEKHNATPVTSIDSTRQRSGLSTVRSATKPREVLAKPNIGPLYSPVTMFESDFGSDAGKPSELPQILQTPAFALLRGAQRAQQSSGSASPKWKRYPCQSPELIGKAGQTR